MAHWFCEVAIGPQAVAPEKFIKSWELSTDFVGRTTLHGLDRVGDSFFRRRLYERMDVTRLHIEFDDRPAIGLGTLRE